MSLYVLADLHLSINIDKPMDIFKGWENYIDKLENNWKKEISDNDTIVLAGDLCWGKTLDESLPSLKFIDSLPGHKIILKGNHDYWWSTQTKMNKFFFKHNLLTLKILYNNFYVVDNICICGTRGWMFENGEQNNTKLIHREAERLKISITGCIDLNLPIIVFLHYPPVYGNQIVSKILSVLNEYHVVKCYYGHIHGTFNETAVNFIHNNIHYQLISCDYVNFYPVKVKL